MYDDVIQNKVVYTLSEFILRWTVLIGQLNNLIVIFKDIWI